MALSRVPEAVAELVSNSRNANLSRPPVSPSVDPLKEKEKNCCVFELSEV